MTTRRLDDDETKGRKEVHPWTSHRPSHHETARRLALPRALLFPPMNNDDAQSGSGRIRLSLHGNEAVFSELSYSYPLKLLSPRVHEPCCGIAYMLTYGGGLVSGDRINVSVEVGSGASLLLLTQVSLGCYFDSTSAKCLLVVLGNNENIQAPSGHSVVSW